jgi:hypothetical protein
MTIVLARYDAQGRRLGLQIRPSRKQALREALKRATTERRAFALEARLIQKTEAAALPPAARVDPHDRTTLVMRLRKPEMTEAEVDDIVYIVEAYLSGRLSAGDWCLWLRRRKEAATAGMQDRLILSGW